MTDQFIEIARREGRHQRSVRLYMRDDGAITFEGQDLGPSVEQIFGDSDYEFWVNVRATVLQKLVFELLREKYTGQIDAVNAFRNWCNAHNIEHEFSNYA